MRGSILDLKKTDLAYLIEEIPEAIKQSIDGIQRVSKIVKAMKEFSHPGGEEKSLLDINKALDNTITVTKNEWKYFAEVETDFDENIAAVYCYPGELSQVFLNLIVNAAQAIETTMNNKENEKGLIYIKTSTFKEYVEILFKDNGCGIPNEILDKIFDPFFTTKEVGKGSGQGLAIAYNVIVKKHGGFLKVDSKVNEGTTFIIHLPIYEK